MIAFIIKACMNTGLLVAFDYAKIFIGRLTAASLYPRPCIDITGVVDKFFAAGPGVTFHYGDAGMIGIEVFIVIAGSSATPVALISGTFITINWFRCIRNRVSESGRYKS
jgi:hypothetical protein